MKDEFTTIKMPKKLVEKLKDMKIHPRQPYYEVIEKLVEDGLSD